MIFTSSGTPAIRCAHNPTLFSVPPLHCRTRALRVHDPGRLLAGRVRADARAGRVCTLPCFRWANDLFGVGQLQLGHDLRRPFQRYAALLALPPHPLCPSPHPHKRSHSPCVYTVCHSQGLDFARAWSPPPPAASTVVARDTPSEPPPPSSPP